MEKLNDFIAMFLGDFKYSSGEYLYYCPKCNHHKRKLSVNTKTMVFKCWVCEYSGNVFKLVKENAYNHLDQFKEKFDGGISKTSLLSTDQFIYDKNNIENLPVELPKEYATLADNGIECKNAIKYLKNREVTTYDIKKYNIGYACAGKFSGRLIFPSYDEDGIINYYVTRTYYDNSIGKTYVNCSENKIDIVFNDLFINWNKPIILAEGIFDSLTIGNNCIPLIGSSLSKKSLLYNKILKNKCDIILALDPDAYKKSLKIANELIKNGINVFYLDVRPFKDPSSCGRKNIKDMLKNVKRIDEYNVMKGLLL